MTRRFVLSAFFIALCLVTISPLFDTVNVKEYGQLNQHQLGYPLPIIEQQTTLTPLEDAFPFQLGLLDPREHPSEILWGNYLISITITGLLVLLLLLTWKRLFLNSSSKGRRHR